ncbi:Gamma-tubulin complex component 4 [Chamberlinius hualienensis]
MELIHELLYALNGWPGDIFTLNDKNEIQVTNVITFCLPAEQQVLNRLCRLGTAYYRITDYIRNVGAVSQTQTINARQVPFRGLYMTAFCDGFNRVLRPYRETLLKLEEEMLKNPHLTLLYIHASLDKYDILFPYLIRLINDLISKEVYGCQILDVIYKHCSCGVLAVSKAMKLLLKVCNEVMIRQLNSFLIHGVIQDPYSEFFVQICESDDHVLPPLKKGDTVIKSLDEHNQAKFHIKAEMVPSYINWKTTEIVLFVGETIHMFAINRDQFKDVITALQTKEEFFSKQLFQLIATDEPQFSDLEITIDCIRAFVAEHLWKLVVESSDLINHLQALKDMFLLGRGELFLDFLDKTDHLMSLPPSTSIEHDIKVEFQMAARSISLEDDTCFQNFRLTVTKKKSRVKPLANPTFVIGNGTVWDYITMEYSPPGILKLLFTSDILDKYNYVFRYLLHVKKVQLELQKCWATQMAGKHFAMSIRQWHLRSCMAFIVDNLQYYLQVDVLESQFCNLLHKVNSTRDFEKIKVDHVSFINNIVMRTFISVGKVSQCLQEFMQLCLAFCGKVKESLHLQPSQLQYFEKAFHQQYTGLITVLNLERSHDVSPHLKQFILRIHFNDYFQNLAIDR